LALVVRSCYWVVLMTLSLKFWPRITNNYYISSMNEARELEIRKDFGKLDTMICRVIHQLAQGHSKLIWDMATSFATVQSYVTAQISKSQDVITAQMTAQTKETLDGVSKSLRELKITTASEERRENLLRSLKFGSMNQRENMIKESHTNTFEWIFSTEDNKDDGKRCDFAHWLCSDQKLYWVSGKAGSGKSTLIKFIISANQTRDLLPLDTIILSYYLWSPGDSMQNSVKGMLLSLLYKLLLKEPALAEILLQDIEYISLKDNVNDWSHTELRRSFIQTLSFCQKPLAIFLDGLDEISSSDGPFELLGLIDEISAIAGVKVKICVASRPEPIFQSRYMSSPNLRLQDLTSSDIRKVCEETLRTLEQAILHDPDLECKTLDLVVDMLVSKAEGVFLWAHLALKSIQRGCSNSDDWEQILLRTVKLPGDLDDLYRSMWSRANVDRGIYEERGAFFLNLILEAQKFSAPVFKNGHISALELMMASDTSVAAAVIERKTRPTAEVRKFTTEDLQRMCMSMMKKIESHCGGLIEFKHEKEREEYCYYGKWEDIIPLSNTEVVFIHRTAYNFLVDTKEGRDILVTDKSPLEDRIINLLYATLAQRSLWGFKTCFDNGYQDAVDDQYWYERILFELGSSGSNVSANKTATLLSSFEKFWRSKYVDGLRYSNGLDLLGKAAQYGLLDFVEAKLNEFEISKGQKIAQSYKDYLLHCATTVPISTYSNHIWSAKCLLVRYLIERGVDGLSKWHDRAGSMWGPFWITTPIMNLTQAAISLLLRNDLELAWQCYDTIQRLLKNRPEMYHKTVMDLGFWKDSFHTWLFFQQYTSDTTRLTQAVDSLVCEVNVVFLLQLFIALLECYQSEERELSGYQSTRIIDTRHLCKDAPFVRVICYGNELSGYSRPLPPAYLDAQVAQSYIIKALRRNNNKATVYEPKVNLFALAGTDGVSEKVKTEEIEKQCEELCKEYMFKYSPPPELLREFPPPIFCNEKDRSSKILD
jgi:hypothetical protein